MSNGELEIDLSYLASHQTMCPTQVSGTTADGRYVYLRYRWGHLTVDIDGREVLREAIGNELDGVMDEMLAVKIAAVAVERDGLSIGSPQAAQVPPGELYGRAAVFTAALQQFLEEARSAAGPIAEESADSLKDFQQLMAKVMRNSAKAGDESE